MDDLIRYANAAVALLCLAIALLIAAVLWGVYFIVAALLSGQAGTLPGAALAVALLVAAYCLTGLVLRQLSIT